MLQKQDFERLNVEVQKVWLEIYNYIPGASYTILALLAILLQSRNAPIGNLLLLMLALNCIAFIRQ